MLFRFLLSDISVVIVVEFMLVLPCDPRIPTDCSPVLSIVASILICDPPVLRGPVEGDEESGGGSVGARVGEVPG